MKTKDKPTTYHNKRALSASYMKLLKQCPAKLAEVWENPPKPTPDMEYGTFFHALVLEPDTVEDDFHVMQFDARTKAGKDEKKANEGKILITEEQGIMATAMKESLLRNKIWNDILSQQGIFETERSFYWEEQAGDTLVPCKARMDGLFISHAGEAYILDLKTTKDASPESLIKTVANFSVHLQAAWYLRALERAGHKDARFIFFYVEKTAPYICTPVMISAESLEIANVEIDHLVQKFADCMKHGFTEEYIPEGDILTISLPSWYQKA